MRFPHCIVGKLIRDSEDLTEFSRITVLPREIDKSFRIKTSLWFIWRWSLLLFYWNKSFYKQRLKKTNAMRNPKYYEYRLFLAVKSHNFIWNVCFLYWIQNIYFNYCGQCHNIYPCLLSFLVVYIGTYSCGWWLAVHMLPSL